MEEENTYFYQRTPERVPNMEVHINQGQQLEFLLPEWLDRDGICADYIPYDLERLQQEGCSAQQLMKYEKYNQTLPVENILEAFLKNAGGMI